MASISSSIQYFPVQQSRFRALSQLPSTTTRNVSNPKSLELSTVPVPAGLFASANPLRFSGSQLLKQRGSFDFPIIKAAAAAAAAADADGQEIEISDGFEPFFF